MIEISKVALIVLAALSFIGGIIGFVKSKSKASIVAGTISAILLGISYYISLGDPFTGLLIGTNITLMLSIMFVVRYFKTRKFMPSGLMIVFSAITFITLVYTLLFSIFPE